MYISPLITLMALLKRSPESHKGNNGIVLVVGGSEIYTGAPALVSIAAYKSGADLVYTCSPKRAADITATFDPQLITIPLAGESLSKSHIKEIEPWLDKADVLAIGPGLGKEREAFEGCRELIEMCDVPMVIDADALSAIAGQLKLLKDKEVILTPHRHEFEVISDGMKATEENAKKFAATIDSETAVLLLKAPIDVITDGKKTKLNKTGNAAMTVGGTGDVLTGIVAGLVAQKVSLFDAAYNAAYINGAAGDICFAEKGYGLVTTDILEKIPYVLKKL